MKTLFLKQLKTTLFLIFLMANCALAQEMIAPINYNPKATVKSNFHPILKTTALSLPFFEDFGHLSAIPDTNKWADRQVYINNTMGVNILSKGVATFDAINSRGLPYDTLSPFSIKYADSLTSKAVDLSGKNPSDSIYLSFFAQPAGNGFAPEKTDSLMLYFKSKTAGKWIKVWSRSDSVLRDFKQEMIAVTDTNYLYNGFQFRFVNKASIGINDDIWNLDYIRLDQGRNRFDTVINDVAYTQTPSNLLNDYTSMPYRQYLANPSTERTSKFKSSVKNNFNIDHNINKFGFTSIVNNSGAAIASDAGTNLFVAAKKTSDIEFNTFSSTPPASYHEKIIFAQQFYFEAISGDLNPENDSIISEQIFDNYLAYDDGTAEMSYYLNLFPTLPGKIAIEHHLNQADTLRGVSIYFGRQVPLASNKYFSIVIYKNIAYGSSSMDNILYEFENLKPSYIDTINHFWIYKFDKAVPLPAGTFYVGTTQPALSGSDSLYFGLDRNRILSNHAFYNVLNVWTPSLVSGAIMMRPILGQEISGSDIKNTARLQNSELSLWPNPCKNDLHFRMKNQNDYYEIINSMGSKIHREPLKSNEGIINLANYPLGNYIINFYEKNTLTASQKFCKF